MRIISGFLKGKKINFVKNSTTRPLKDSVKENIFNILKHSNDIIARIEKSYILDLYSGIGSFGIECISRGAKNVTFVERDTTATNILKKNLIHLSIFKNSNIFSGDIQEILKKNIFGKFNIFFLDPPFKEKKFTQNLKLIKQKKIFTDNHIIVIHRERKTKDNFENLIKIINIKEYGRSKIIFGSFI